MGSGGRINGITSDFVYSIRRPDGGIVSREPISGVYNGYFWIKFNPPRKITENRMQLIFTQTNGGYSVTGSGSNRLGPYQLQGTYNPDTQEMTCIKVYKVDTTKPKRVDPPTVPRSSSRLVEASPLSSLVPQFGERHPLHRSLGCPRVLPTAPEADAPQVGETLHAARGPRGAPHPRLL